jgi:flagellar biosynthesis protein FlhF
MQIHRIRAASLKEALLRARQTYGEDAVVISQETLAGGEVALAIAQRDAATVSSAVFRNTERKPKQAAVLRELDARLARQGTSPEYRAELCSAVERRLSQGSHPVDLAAEDIAKHFAPARLTRIPGKTRVLTLVGSTGSGKTTTLVKLAHGMLQAGRKVELATLDSHRVGAVEQLRAFAQQLGIPMTVLKRGVRMNPKVLAAGGVDMLLLDTTGHALQDVPMLAQMTKSLQHAPVAIDVHLVLPASTSARARAEQHELYAPLQPAGCIVTKLDETGDKASALEFARSRQLPVSFLCDGTRIEHDLHRATGANVADLFLMGKLS